MAFVAHIEKLSRRPEYRQLWPDRVPDVGEESFAGEAFGTIGAVTIYTWEREEFVLSLEERQTRRGEPSFRWLACVPMGSPDAVIALARRRAETH